MLSVELPKTVEKQLQDVVQKSYQGDIKTAIVAFLKCNIYNGSDWTLTEVSINVTVYIKNGTEEELSRRYRLYKKPYANGKPFESSKFHAGLGFKLTEGRNGVGILSRLKG
jgi:hypothetical protein